MKSKVAHSLWEFTCVVVFSAVAGAGVATVQSFFAFAETETLPISMTEAFILGIVVGPVAGLATHYLIFRRQMNFQMLSAMLTITTLVGSSAGLCMNLLTHGEGGWLSLFISVVTWAIVAIIYRWGHVNRSDASTSSEHRSDL